MTAVSKEEIDIWVSAIAILHASVARDPGDERAAADAVANLWSGFGYQDAPMNVLQMFVQAIEIGYMTALQGVRNGDFDDEIRMWRPNLHEA
ncbi:MAG: hypothetical protein ACRDPK_00510 [Carbonactinosporaceae bacterium]